MTEDQWCREVEEHRQVLTALLREYHPVNRDPCTRPGDRITAEAAERQCVLIRRNIRQNFEGDPVALFGEALTSGNVALVSNLLNDTWFGFPESRWSRQIPGWGQLVRLIEEVPEDADVDSP